MRLLRARWMACDISSSSVSGINTRHWGCDVLREGNCSGPATALRRLYKQASWGLHPGGVSGPGGRCQVRPGACGLPAGLRARVRGRWGGGRRDVLLLQCDARAARQIRRHAAPHPGPRGALCIVSSRTPCRTTWDLLELSRTFHQRTHLIQRSVGAFWLATVEKTAVSGGRFCGSLP